MSRSRSFEAFRRIVTVVAGGGDLAGVLSAVVEAVEAEIPKGLGSILLLDADGQRLRHGAAPSLPESYIQAIDGVAIGPRAGSCGTAMYLNRAILVENIQTDPLWADYRDLAAQAGLAACWSQPIRASDGAVLGSFAIYHRKPRAPRKGDIAFIEAAAEVAAFAIERQRAAESLARSRELAQALAVREQEASANLRTFFEVSVEMLCITDLQGRFVRVNRAWEETLGYAAGELEGMLYSELVHPDDLAPTRAAARLMIKTLNVADFVNRCRRRDGEYRMLEWSTRVVGDLAFCVARDITESVQVSRELEAARAAAEAANRAKSDFLANMSHELRTPLNGVIGVVTALQRTALTPIQRDMLDIVRTSGATLERLLSDILDVSRIEAGQLDIQISRFNLVDELKGSLELHGMRARETGLVLDVAFGPAAAGDFEGDPVRIRQVLDNFLSNAIKFTPQGRIEVAIDIEDVPEGAGDCRLAMAVRDTGLGFDSALADRLFQRFDQGETASTRRFGGAGLGLAISKSLVEMMGGAIEVDSAPGHGSLFRAVIPLRRSNRDAWSAGVAQPEVSDDAERGLRVLLAEDNPTNQRVVQLILEPAGVDLIIVENGAEAVGAFQRERFDLVLMDLQMPVMDGLAAIRAIRRHEAGLPDHPRTPIVVLSASAMPQHREAALTAGADLHVAKPVTASALVMGINSALAAHA